MTRHAYHERDSTFGQALFKLRTSIGHQSQWEASEWELRWSQAIGSVGAIELGL